MEQKRAARFASPSSSNTNADFPPSSRNRASPSLSGGHDLAADE
jgi:hypothetical protein